MRDCWKFWTRDLSTTSMFGVTKDTTIRLGPRRVPLLNALLSTSLIGSFAWTATLLFWFFRNCWPGHWWSRVQRWGGCYQLFWIFPMKGADQLSEVYDCQWKLLGIFFFWVTLLQNKIVEAWHLVVCLLAVHCAVDDCFDLILFIASGLKFNIFFWLW